MGAAGGGDVRGPGSARRLCLDKRERCKSLSRPARLVSPETSRERRGYLGQLALSPRRIPRKKKKGARLLAQFGNRGSARRTETELGGGDRPGPPYRSSLGPGSASLVWPLPLRSRRRGLDTPRQRLPRAVTQGGDPGRCSWLPVAPARVRATSHSPRSLPGHVRVRTSNSLALPPCAPRPGQPRPAWPVPRGGRTHVSGSAGIPGAVRPARRDPPRLAGRCGASWGRLLRGAGGSGLVGSGRAGWGPGW